MWWVFWFYVGVFGALCAYLGIENRFRERRHARRAALLAKYGSYSALRAAQHRAAVEAIYGRKGDA